MQWNTHDGIYVIHVILLTKSRDQMTKNNKYGIGLSSRLRLKIESVHFPVFSKSEHTVVILYWLSKRSEQRPPRAWWNNFVVLMQTVIIMK